MRINIDTYKQQLLEHGFTEATQRPLHFWKNLTEKTAFIVNLKRLSEGVGVVYGVISTAVFWTEGDWKFFENFGRSDDDCNLRYYLEIGSEDDEIAACNAIGNLYEEYRFADKDALLAVVKERRKQFFQQINNILKPLGFRKKGNLWRKSLSDRVMLEFWADKSSYSDLYRFEVGVYAQTPVGIRGCYSKRLYTKKADVFDMKGYADPWHLFDWQLYSTEDLLEIVNRAYEEEMYPFIEHGLEEMGRQPFVQENCHCSREHCEHCWMEKNMWEEKEV